MVAAGAVIAGSIGSASADTLQKLRDQGYATVAVANEPPYSDVKGDGYVTGAAPDVARAVMKKLGVPELKAQVVAYGSMIPALLARRVDMATSGLYIKPKRCESIIYSEPDLCGAEAFAVMKGNPHNILTYEDIGKNPDVTMTTCAGCAEEAYALERGVSAEQIKVFTDPPSGIKMLQQGRVDVFALSGLGTQDLLRKFNDPNLELIMPVKGVPMGCAGAAFNPEDKDFRDAYDQALKELKDSGEFAKIIEPYGFSTEATLAVKRDDFCPGN
ncbi:ectoine/hydroxyectoine ABC transporter substrate-binding protein EhuB [Hwanghaeella grinnelliae]|uniref:Ectoine/hydroxyectoine ABC transporter substrate-binding protein EhuB n=1 Tax=Hwanghaeella grinnelliae TaxID=2500179 RepID=A0A3S2VPA8_9PROT|nr:ectoine/hydroxyectoine ABC transporter substrate-binding protein EhuB [Hwanghaeella grinnelliae]RVU36199.1 ectoine/hydroxyectoine ABC transporter substrate-binding protein EhuB [Hwanghaeella grinnelliae]